MLDFATDVWDSICWLLQDLSSLATWYEFGVLCLIDVGLTAFASLTIGKLLARRSKILAAIVCGLLIPLSLYIAAELALMKGPQGPYTPEGYVNDGPVMVYIGLLQFALLSFPVSLITSALIFSRYAGRTPRALP